MPSPTGTCAKREEYTEAERAAEEQKFEETMRRVGAAVEALPKPIPMNSQGKIACPTCGADLHYSRWQRGAAIQCVTANCTGPVRFNIAYGADWPS